MEEVQENETAEQAQNKEMQIMEHEQEPAARPASSLVDPRSLRRGVYYAVGGVVVGALALFFYGVYGPGWQSTLITKPATALHLPVASVGGATISYGRLQEYIGLIQGFRAMDIKSGAAAPAAITRAQDVETALQRFREMEVLHQLAEQYNVSVEPNTAWAIYESRGVPLPTDADLAAVGTNRDRFQEIILTPVLLAEKVGAAIAADTKYIAEATTKINEVYERVTTKKEDFATVAKEVSDDTGSAANGGDLDWFGKGVMVEAFEKAAFSLKKGEISKPVQSPYGQHIIQVTDIRKNPKTKAPEVRARHILVAFPSLNEIASQKEKSVEVDSYVHWR